MTSTHDTWTRHDPGVGPEVHTWTLTDVSFEDAVTIRCFECVECGTVRFE
jgi:hypothetical protein